MIKYKHAESTGWYYKIDINDETDEIISQQSFDKKHGFYQEMLDSGIEIEPLYTPEELKEKEKVDHQNALENQRSQCIQLLDDSEKSVSDDPPYPDNVEEWKTARAQWRTILKSDQLETIPDSPF